MSTVAIVAVEYLEPEYEATRNCILACNVPTVFIDRQGTGNLAEAYNRGFVETLNFRTDYVWFVSNPTFDPAILPLLVQAMDETGFAAIHPAFDSDHMHLRPTHTSPSPVTCVAGAQALPPSKGAGECSEPGDVRVVPYIEFTAPIVRTDVFLQCPLDGKLPYWGHDLDWSHRVREQGHQLGVHYCARLQHEYIRHNKTKHPITLKRHQLRKQSNAATTQRLVDLYGPHWREVLEYQG